MPIPTVVESEDQIPEGLGEYYEQGEDGTYALALDGIESHPRVRPVLDSLEKNKKSRQKANDEVRQLREKADLIPDDLDKETLQEAIERIRSGGDSPGGQQGADGQQGQQGQQQDAAKIRKQLEERYQKEMEQVQAERDKIDQKYRQREVRSQLDAALQKHGVTSPALRRAAMNDLSQYVQAEYDDDGELDISVNADVDGLNVDEFVKNWVSTEEGQEFLPKASGSGARGANGKGASGAKEMKREQFDQLAAEDKQKFIQNGGKLVD